MTVYELIQLLSRHPADMPVKIGPMRRGKWKAGDEQTATSLRSDDTRLHPQGCVVVCGRKP